MYHNLHCVRCLTTNSAPSARGGAPCLLRHLPGGRRFQRIEDAIRPSEYRHAGGAHRHLYVTTWYKCHMV